MKLKDLLAGVEVVDIRGNVNIEINDLILDSSKINNSGLFFCYKGVTDDGHNYFKNAEKSGAKALIVENFLPTLLTQIKVKNTRECISAICSNFYGNPAKLLKIIGVSGTNGKTTSTYIMREILKSAGHKVGLIGTSAVYINEICYPATLTTPDPTELHKLFSQMVSAGCDSVIMEVSAHAIDLLKVYGIKFEVGIFTNLTQDHLDYFKTMENYAATKQKFFSAQYCKTCVINVDDSYGKSYFEACDTNKFSYGLINPADGFAINLDMNLKGSSFVCNLMDNIIELNLKLAGKFNIYNCLGVALACKVLGLSDEAIKSGIAKLVQVEGRFNVIDAKGYEIVIDYAHSPDGLENILKNVKSLCSGNIICVFGCGGNRDALKRPIMGQIAAKYSDTVIITSDNPRFENAEKIIDQIADGITHTDIDIIRIENRRQAIHMALSLAAEGDVVVVCGKGAEDYQEINGIKYPFKDREVVEEFLFDERKNILRG